MEEKEREKKLKQKKEKERGEVIRSILFFVVES